MSAVLLVGLLAVPIVATNRARQAAIRGFGHVGASVVPEAIIHPASLLVAAVAIYYAGGRSLASTDATALYVGSLGLAWLVGALALRRFRPPELRSASRRYALRDWARGIGPFVVLAGLEVVHSNTDVIMLGFLADSDAAGIYRIAHRMAGLAAFPIAAISLALGPVVAREFAADNMRKIQQLATSAARAGLLLALGVTGGLALLGPWVLGLLGSEFAAGYIPMLTLAGAHLVNAGLGCAALILMMTHHEVDAAVAVGFGALFNVALNALLIPMWDIQGAAIATTISTATVGAMLAVQLWRRFEIQPTVIRLGPKE
jgi:O-antigen/teichoic acid export membrane protein